MVLLSEVNLHFSAADKGLAFDGDTYRAIARRVRPMRRTNFGMVYFHSFQWKKFSMMQR
jgi:hypothetical protein